MRLIDADGFIEYLRKYAYPDSFITGVQLALNGVPEIQQERTAQKKLDPTCGRICCSACGISRVNVGHYCFNCGAKFTREG